MKKVLSLLLVCTMIFSLAAISIVSAAETATYNFSAASITAEKSGRKYKLVFTENATEFGTGSLYDANWENPVENTVIALAVSSNVLAGSGHFVLEYDNTKVIPAVVTNTDDAVEGLAYNALDGEYTVNDCLQMQAPQGPQAADTVSNAGLHITDNKIALTWMAGNTSGGVNANETLAYITFFVKEGKSTSDFNNTTFKIADDISDINDVITDKAKESYGAMFIASTSEFSAKASNLTASFTYPNSDKGDEPQPSDWKTTTDATEAGFNTAQDIQFRTETAKDASDAANGNSADIKRKVVIFAKNTTGNTLDPQTYGIQIGNAFYPGVGTVSADQYWAIILVDTTDSKLTVGTTYNYSAKINGTEIGTGTATVQ